MFFVFIYLIIYYILFNIIYLFSYKNFLNIIFYPKYITINSYIVIHKHF